MSVVVKNHPYLENLTVSTDGSKVFYKKKEVSIYFDEIKVVRLPYATFPVSKLVLETFKGVPPKISNYEIVFIDGDQNNTKPFNLSWTRKLNKRTDCKTNLTQFINLPETLFTFDELKKIASFIVSENDVHEERLRFKFGVSYVKLFQVLGVLENLDIITPHRSNMIREVLPENFKKLNQE